MKTFSSLYFWSANTDKLLKKVRPGDSLISYACDVTWLTHRAQGKVQLIHTFHYGEAWWKDLCGRCSRRNQLYEQFLYSHTGSNRYGSTRPPTTPKSA